MGIWKSPAGGGGSFDPNTLPSAGDNPPPDLYLVSQSGAWKRAGLAQMQGWLGGAALTGGSVRQERFLVAGGGQSAFILAAVPLNGIAIISLNGLMQHEYSVLGQTVTLTEPAQAGDGVLITCWAA